jgi:polyphosphate kinase
MAEKSVTFLEPELYTNRELSWLLFNRRVLGEARDTGIPLFERLKFLSITASNLDEFFMIRVASLKDMVHANYKKQDIAGMTPKEQLDALGKEIHDLVERQYSTYNRSLLPGLMDNGLEVVRHHEDLTEQEAAYVDQYFEENVYPVLTPMAVDASRPFPLLRNKTLNIGAIVCKKEATKSEMFEKTEQDDKSDKYPESINMALNNGELVYKRELSISDITENEKIPIEKVKSEKDSKSGKDGKSEKKEKSEKDRKIELEFASVQVPGVIPRIVLLPSIGGKQKIILLEEVIERNIHKLFLNYTIVCAHPFRIMRNADLTLDEDEAADLLKEIEKQIKKRQWGEVIRLEVEGGMDKKLLNILKKELSIEGDSIFKIDGPLDLTFLMKVYGLPGYSHLKEPKYVPQTHPRLPTGCNIFAEIRKGDILLHHPYQSFDPVVSFIRQAAEDPEVLAIKQTLYRVSGNSPIIAALARAAENGKQVCVLVELKARFDEEHNILWAKMLEQAGAHVIYGLVGLKTHSKITLVVRREETGIRRYVHLGTGNYNDATARQYTDIGMFTCGDSYGEDATAVFNMLSGYSEPRYWNKLVLAPLWLKDAFLRMIDREREYAKEGKNARIVAKVNALCDRDIIQALYRASAEGVKIDLIVRGICSLKVGLPGISENIQVRSIVGNFLEHSRIFYLENGGNPEVYCGSADWMPRNLERRVEILFPIEEKELKEEVIHILKSELRDTMKARILMPDGSYDRVDKRGKESFSSQKAFCLEAKKKALPMEMPSESSRVFIPEEG